MTKPNSQMRTGIRLTDAKLRTLAAGSKVMTDSVTSGLMYEPSKSSKGVGSWIIRYSLKGKARSKLVIGKYPAMGIEQAREKANSLLSNARNGIHPKEIIAREAIEKQQYLNSTFASIANEFYEDRLKQGVWKNERYKQQWIREMKNHIFPKLGNLPIGNIKPADIKRTLDEIWNRIPTTAEKLLGYISQIMDYAISLEYCEYNPCHAAKIALGKQIKKASSERRMPALSYKDLPRFIVEVILLGGKTQGKRALLFLILNAARSGAVRLLEFSEIDETRKLWTMPANKKERKTNVDREYPLSWQALLILQSQKKEEKTIDLVFPNNKPNKRGGYVLSDMTLTKIIRDNPKRFDSDIKGRLPTVHGFRTTFRGWASIHKYTEKEIEIQLAHNVGTAVQQAYDREQLTESRRKMMQEWANFIFSEVEGDVREVLNEWLS